ncbi:hypothetical protein FNV43_RR06991 [Rhamnella rubrinervis]|uniref:Uncharacterized protein n=1 Tax=Rhamnella rubrinervis TaxID=2594499 RepID=A0A8K0HDY0_9ROSA|nr:hypothetical protein FNV43_RR06991 [Rhamnella rubrinervis]
MAIATAGPSNSKLCRWRSDYPRLNPAKKMKWIRFSCTELAIHNSVYSSRLAPTTRLNPIRALSGGKEPEDPKTSKNGHALVSKEDAAYLWKLGVGSVVGAAVIKYGSVVFPEITRPSIIQALIIIVTPLVVAVLLLINQSRAERDQVS